SRQLGILDVAGRLVGGYSHSVLQKQRVVAVGERLALVPDTHLGWLAFSDIVDKTTHFIRGLVTRAAFDAASDINRVRLDGMNRLRNVVVCQSTSQDHGHARMETSQQVPGCRPAGSAVQTLRMAIHQNGSRKVVYGAAFFQVVRYVFQGAPVAHLKGR